MPRFANPFFESQRLAKLTERNRNCLVQTEFLLIATFCDLWSPRRGLAPQSRGTRQESPIAAKAIQYFFSQGVARRGQI